MALTAPSAGSYRPSAPRSTPPGRSTPIRSRAWSSTSSAEVCTVCSRWDRPARSPISPTRSARRSWRPWSGRPLYRVPVLAGVIDTTTARVIDHARVAARLGADALVATAPFYTRTHPKEIAGHFRRIRAGVDLPLFAYDLPVSVHSKLSAPLVRELAEDGTLAGLKDSSGDEGGLRRLLVELGGRDGRSQGPVPRFSILTGSELTVDAALLAGADGVVPGIGNVDPAAYVRLYEAARAGDWTLAAKEQERLVSLFDIVDVGPEGDMGRSSSALGSFKGALRLLGVIACGDTAFPQIQLGAASLALIAEPLRAAGLTPPR